MVLQSALSVSSWAAWTPDITTTDEWLLWAKGRNAKFRPKKLDLSSIPPLKRRRMSQLSKIALVTAARCLEKTGLENAGQCVSIFCSQHGELVRTVKILQVLAAGEDISPTDFSLSVHNSALGLHSILNNNQLPASTVAAGSDTFGHGLLEAAVQLNKHPTKPVLLVCFDEPIPSPLSNLEDRSEEPYCVSLLLTRGPHNQFRFGYRACRNELVTKKPLALNFIKFLLNEKTYREVIGGRLVWGWKKC